MMIIFKLLVKVPCYPQVKDNTPFYLFESTNLKRHLNKMFKAFFYGFVEKGNKYVYKKNHISCK